MSRDADSDELAPPHPRSTFVLLGHGESERALLEAYRDRRFPHAWLIGGPHGIGKATLAYRLARFILAHPDPAAHEVREAETLTVDPEHPVSRRIAAQGHGNLLALERTLSDSGVLRTEIQVDDVRKTVDFFGHTAGEGGWRICIIDTADDLNRFGANALLKMIEEPPERALFLVISHTPGRLLPTIRSRCRRLTLKPLAVDDVSAAVAAVLGRDANEPDIHEAAMAADGSVARALGLLSPGRLIHRQTVSGLLARLPEIDDRALHALGDGLGRAHEGAFDLVVESIRAWLSEQLRNEQSSPARLARIAEVWEKFDATARETEAFNLERKPMVFAAFGLLAEVARG